MKYSILISALIASTLMTGCASQLQAVKAFNSAAVVSLQAAEDINLARLKFEICATPYSALVRHPDLVPGVSAMCLPGGNLTNPANLLYGILNKPQLNIAPVMDVPVPATVAATPKQ